MRKSVQRYLAFGFGMVFVVVFLVLAIRYPNPTPFQYNVFRIILAVASGGVAAMIPGFLSVQVSTWLRTGGALSIFVIAYFYSAAGLTGVKVKTDQEIEIEQPIGQGDDGSNKPPDLDVPEIVKKDCQRLVDGLLLFEPSKTMRQGQAYPVFARLTRNPRVNITEGLEGSKFVIVAERVSCKVSMNLDSDEVEAFKIQNVPEGRKDEQLLEPDKYSEWDWRVMPKKHGSLHLLLFVTPMLYVDGIGEGLKAFKQPPKVITVTPDYWYAVRQFFNDNWAIISGLLSLIIIPLFLWFRKEILGWIEERLKKKPKPIGFQPVASAPKEQVGIADKNRE